MTEPDHVPRLDAYPVWDPAVRVTHWLIATLFLWLALSGHFGWWPMGHLWAGYALTATLVFRLAWGVLGSKSTRFGTMLAGMRALRPTLADIGRRQPGYAAGHNPLGAISVLLMIALLLAQSITGLFYESWGEVRGPLAERIARDSMVILSDLHGLLFWPLLALVFVHVFAGLYHLGWKRENRLGAIFVHGRLELPNDPGLRQAGAMKALCMAVAAVAAVLGLVWWGPVA